MHPDGGTVLRIAQALRHASQALGESGAVFAVAQQAEQPDGRGEQQGHGGQRAVEEIHAVKGHSK